MSGADVTIWVILLAVVTLIVYNTWVTMSAFPGATISETVLYVAQKWPVIPLMAGMLMGHLFWPQYRPAMPPLPVPGLAADTRPGPGLRPARPLE